MVQTTQNFELFDKKPGFKNYFWQSNDAILEDVSVADTINCFDAKLFVRLPFSVSKIMVVQHL